MTPPKIAAAAAVTIPEVGQQDGGVGNGVTPSSPWLLGIEAATYLRISAKTIYREARAGRLRHARVGGRRELRFRREWLDQWLEATATPIEVRR